MGIQLTENVKNFNDALEVFGLNEVPDEQELKSLYKELSKKYHPDRGGSTEDMKDVNAAYEILKNNVGKKGKEKSYAEYKKEKEEKDEVIFYTMKSIFEEEFDPDALFDYLKDFVPEEELDISISRPEEYNSRSYYAEVYYKVIIEIFNPERDLVFHLMYYIFPKNVESGGLTAPEMDEKDILYGVSTEVDIYFERRKQKLAKSSFEWGRNYGVLSDYEAIFPPSKLNKILSGGGKKTFKRADFELGLRRELGDINQNKDTYFVYIKGNPRDTRTYIAINRMTMMRQAVYSIWGMYSFSNKTGKLEARRNLMSNYLSMYETEQTLIDIVSAIKEIKEEIKDLDERTQGDEIFEVAKEIMAEYFPKDYAEK